MNLLVINMDHIAFPINMFQTKHETLNSDLDVFFSIFEYNNEIEVDDTAGLDQVQQPVEILQLNQVQNPLEIQKLNQVHQDTANSGPRVIRWTNEEDLFLLKFIPKHGKRWAKAARKLNKKLYSSEAIRSGRHCRERWRNHLDPNLNSNS